MEPYVADAAAMDWVESPAGGVARKRLEHAGEAESGRVTSIVRYKPGARFPLHRHPEGEEFLVLEGTFSDEHGDYPAGTFVFNPHGSSHAPYTRDGCVLFVKLRQYPGERERVVLNTDDLPSVPGRSDGLTQRVLYDPPDHPEQVRLVRIPPGGQAGLHDHPDGEEVLVLEGEIADENGRYGPLCWFHYRPGSRHAPYSEKGCLLYVRTGGLTSLEPPDEKG